MRVAGGRLLGVAVALLMVSGVAACAAPEPSPSQRRPAPIAGLSTEATPQPTQDRAGLDECMAAAGWMVHPATTGSNGVYSWERTSYFTWDASAPAPNPFAGGCEEKFAPARQKTVDELREIYSRWLLERQCLISFGFHPIVPTSFERFQIEWTTTGPWMPIDGVPYGEIQGYVKERCGLEMIP